MNAAKNIISNWQDDEALRRFKLISPLLSSDLDEAKRIQLREKIAADNNVSVRSLYRYEKAWQNGEFQGLKPAPRNKNRIQNLPENFDSLLNEAIQLRREVPSRSINQIILILELEGKAAPGVLKRATLQRHMYDAGFGATHLNTYKDARESSSKRFCKPHRMMLIQGDIKYGPILPIGKKGAKVQTYLSSAIDDHSRFILHSQFYDNQEETIVEDTFHQAINRYGKFDSCYFDNGSQYIAKQLRLSLAKLGIVISHCKIRSGKSKGKIEKFHQIVDTFIAEAKLKKITTLEELNYYWSIFLEQYYQKAPHEGIKEYYTSLGADVPECGITPMQEWNRDSRALNYISTDVVSEAFLHHEKRRVDKGACISFQGRKYETKPSLIGFIVEIAYDSKNTEELQIHFPGMETFIARPVKIGSFCDKKETLPISMQLATPTTSRLIDALEVKYNDDHKQMADAISFADYRKEASSNV